MPAVLYIGGMGRSGSTILANVLGCHEHTWSIGEFVHVFERGRRDRELCGCGQLLPECEVWQAIGDAAFGGWENLDLDETLALQHAVDQNRYAVRTLGQGSPELREYAALLGQLYQAVHAVSGCPVIVDSSKHTSTAYVLRHVPDIDLRLVHLVRDSRGVAYSWTKSVTRPEAVGTADQMPRYHPVRSGLKWSAYNAMFHGLTGLGVPLMRVRYEDDFIADPRRCVAEILAFAGVEPGPLPFVGDDWVELTPSHTVSGNPNRFSVGRIDLALDNEWRSRLPAHDRRIVGTMTWPLRRAYGYA